MKRARAMRWILGGLSALSLIARPPAALLWTIAGAAMFGLLLGLLICAAARADTGSGHTRTVLPQVPAIQRLVLIREARRIWGLDAPVARFAAQIHMESSWRTSAQSPYADGLAQVTPATAAWLAETYPRELQPAAPWDPTWSKRALLIYDRHIYQRELDWFDDGHRWAGTLVGYVGGPGWVNRERLAAAQAGVDSDRWWGQVEHVCLRRESACTESRHYPRRILCELEPAWIRAGWPGKSVCP